MHPVSFRAPPPRTVVCINLPDAPLSLGQMGESTPMREAPAMLNGQGRNPSRPTLALRCKQDFPLASRGSPPSRRCSSCFIPRRMRWLIAFCGVAACAPFATQAHAQEKPTLRLVQTIPLPGVEGRLYHIITRAFRSNARLGVRTCGLNERDHSGAPTQNL